MYFFFLFWSPMLFFLSLQYLIKGAFVSPEKHFKKSFYTLPCVWLRMKNLVKRKIIFVDCKITHFSHKINYTLILPSNDFQDLQTEREREREREREERAQGFETHLPSAPPHTPTRERCSSTPHADADSRSPTLRRAVPPYLIHSTSPPPTLSSTCTRSTKAKLSLMPTKPISPSTSLIRHSHIASETLLSNPPSTIPNPHPFKPISLFFSSLTQPHLRDHAAEIIAHDPPMTNLSLSRSTYLFPPIFDHSLCLPLLVWSNCLSLGNDFVFIFVFLSLYIEIFNYKICLEAKKVAEKKWENSIFIMQTNTWKYFLKQFLYYS